MNNVRINDQVFVPVTDEMIYNHPEQIEGPLVPYEAGMECHEWMSIELNPEDDSEIERIVRKRTAQLNKAKSNSPQSANLSLVYGDLYRRC